MGTEGGGEVYDGRRHTVGLGVSAFPSIWGGAWSTQDGRDRSHARMPCVPRVVPCAVCPPLRIDMILDKIRTELASRHGLARSRN